MQKLERSSENIDCKREKNVKNSMRKTSLVNIEYR